ncbi:MAG: prenyltransferase/squalene oxidase repeat-containing protein [Planctomycetota bacterium]
MLRFGLASALLTSLLTAQSPLGGSLPTVGTLGDAPTEQVFTIELHDTGSLSVAGIPLSYDQCLAKLAIAAQRLPGDAVAGMKTSRLNVLIRAADAVPAIAIDKLMRACADPKVMTPRIFFAASHVEDGREGAFALFLPYDSGGAADATTEIIPVVVESGDEGSVDGLEAYLRRFVAAMQPAQREGATVHLQAGGDLRWREGMQLLDACARCGIRATYLEVRATAEQNRAWAKAHDLRALCQASPARKDVGCRIGPMVVRSEQPSAAPARVRGAFAGFARSTRSVSLEELEIVEEEVVEEEVVEEPFDGSSGGEAASGGRAGGRFGGRLTRREGRAPKATARAVDLGLAWLAEHQDESGRWDSDGFMKHDAGKDTVCDGAGNPVHDVGVTGLALLAFLGAGNTMRAGPYKEQVKRGVKWLIDQQDERSGLIGKNVSHDFIYGHAIATWALCEAYGLSNFELLKPKAQRAINYLESHRNPYSVWRYQPRDNDNDTSITTWCVMAYRAGKDFGLDVNKNALLLAANYYDEVADPATGRHGYTRRGERSSRMPGDHGKRFPTAKNEALTGASLFARYMLGQAPKDHPIMSKAATLIASQPPAWTPKAGNLDYYAWYWSSMALYQHGGAAWKRWATPMSKALTSGQQQQGAERGSWDPVDVWGEPGGRVASTALATMSLQSYYRFAALVR